MRLTVSSWDPTYGTTMEPSDPDQAPPDIDPDVETPAGKWAPVSPPAGLQRPGRVLFLDGVRRTDALLWATPGGASRPRQALAASYAAGIVESTPTAAALIDAQVRRIIAGPAGIPALDLAANSEMYRPVTVGTEPSSTQLSNAVQERLGLLEQHVAHTFSSGDLTVVDGPLTGRQQTPNVVGYIKTHQVAYLPDELEQTVAALTAGQRTPLFATLPGRGYSRLSFYLRLTGDVGHPWAAVVRCEMTPEQPIGDAVATADLLATILPMYASQPHRDPRAPQNLSPIASLESELRRRLGDRDILTRLLRVHIAGMDPREQNS